ncbi:hypothetical protein BDZ45DRAFT_324674 [Acephala macrosclerotiorum]|nr:hypothetical protein BDZ45DRAFT_324674 [Acephala macrosclerotiorum]
MIHPCSCHQLFPAACSLHSPALAAPRPLTQPTTRTLTRLRKYDGFEAMSEMPQLSCSTAADADVNPPSIPKYHS